MATGILTLLQYNDCRITDDCFKLVPFFLVQVLMFLVYLGMSFLFAFYDFKVRYSTPSSV